MKTVILDLDGTLCDHSARIHLAKDRKLDEYFAGIPNDPPHMHIVFLVKALWNQGYRIVALTGRGEEHRKATKEWLVANRLYEYIDKIVMRPLGDRRQDDIVKLELLDDLFGTREMALRSVLFCIEDRNRVVRAMRDAGFNVLHVADGDF